MHTHYDNLKVTRGAPAEVIRAAYKALSQRYHPDKNPSPDAQRIMRIINEAYRVLGDPDRRAAYDRELNERERQAPKVQGPSASAPQQSTAAARDANASVKPSPSASSAPFAPGRQKATDTAAAATTGTKKRGLSRKAIVALVLVILFCAPWAWHTYQRFSSGGHAANTARSAASSVTWTNPVTHASVSIDGIWKLSVTGAETGQPVYTFTEANGSAAIVFAHEDLPGVGFNKYIPAYIRNNAATMPLGAPGIRETIDGHESWSTDGHLSSAPSMKTHAELRHIGPSFWRLVVVQAPPYEQTDDATRTLKAQLWATLASF
jgi:DnaJ domain